MSSIDDRRRNEGKWDIIHGFKRDGFIPLGSVKKIFEGSKSFWRTRTTIDVLIFEHFTKISDNNNDAVHIVEVVAFDPHTNKEAPHLYIKSKELCDNIRRHEAASSSSSSLLSPSTTTDSDIVPGTKTGQDAMAKYIFSRVGVVATGSKAAIPCVSSVSPNAHESFHEIIKHLPPQLSLSPSGKKAIGTTQSNNKNNDNTRDNNDSDNLMSEQQSPRATPDLEDPVLAATAAVMEKFGFQTTSTAEAGGKLSRSDDSDNTFQIELLKMGKDDAADLPYVCESVPSDLCKLPDLKRLRFTKSVVDPEVFTRKIAEIRKTNLLIDRDLLEAEKITDIDITSISNFHELYTMLRERSVYHAEWSTAKRRWKKAINIIMLRIGVAKTTTRLGEIAARHKFRTPPISNPSSGPVTPRSARSNKGLNGHSQGHSQGHGVSGGLAANEHLPKLAIGNNKHPATVHFESLSSRPPAAATKSEPDGLKAATARS